MIKSRMRRAGIVARIEWKRNAYRVLMGKFERKRPIGRVDIDEITIIKCILDK
jgi:hypothetical protein